MELLLGYEILESYKRLSYKEWYAFAEFVDNSTQSYRNNKKLLDEAYGKEGGGLDVVISYSNDKDGGYIQIKDNACGMSLAELKRALILGKKPQNDTERSKYGLGLKTAAFWFGDEWHIQTKKLGEKKEYIVTVDLNKILSDEKSYYKEKGKDETDQHNNRFIPELEFLETDSPEEVHGTIITIRQLNRKITPSKAKKTKAFLRSIYRVDLERKLLSLNFQGEELTWNQEEILSRILVNKTTGEKYYRELNFKVNEHVVKGWAGILKHGSRPEAGFSLLQADRVIQGYPDNYKPSMLFGDQEGGINNLVNQRLIGELYLDSFEVSHTKDEILFKEDEESVLDTQLFAELADYKKEAERFRVREEEEETVGIDFGDVVTSVVKSINIPEFRAAVFRKDVLPEAIIEKTNVELYDRIVKNDPIIIEAELDNLKISVIISNESSPYDPYLICRARAEKDSLVVIINKNHPYWDEMSGKDAIYSFVKNCIYDGVAEWKAYFLINTINPDTIKLIKDHLLRVPIELPF